MAMLSKVGNENLTLLQSISPPGDSAPAPAPAPAPSQIPIPVPHLLRSSGNVENFKNDLNCYCHKLGIPLPVYETRVEGSAHALRFRSTVTVAQNTFTPPSDTFATRKSASEQEAAKLALQHLLTQDLANSSNLRLHLRKLVRQDKTRCKMILNEFLAKLKLECSYETLQVKVVPPMFVSSLALNSTCYKGEPGKNKKEAEQLAALEAILSLLDDPTYAASVSSVIKSKFDVRAAFNEFKENPTTGDCSVSGNMCKTTTSNILVPLSQKASLMDRSKFRVFVDEKTPTPPVDLQANNTEEQVDSENLVIKNRQGLVNSLPQIEKQSGQGGSGLATEAIDSSCSYVNLPITSPSLSKPQQQINVPIEKQGDPLIMDNKKVGAGLPTEAVTISLPITSPSVPVEKQGVQCALDDKKGGVEFPTESVTISYVNPPPLSKPQHGIILPEAAQSDFREDSVSMPPAALSPVYDLISSKKRERNKRKANKKKENKRLRAENKMLSL